MSVSSLSLLTTRRLGPLALATVTGAFNDNLVKTAIVTLVIFRLGAGGAGLSALASALFIAPYALLSATAGQLADRFRKPRVVLAAKACELVLMLGAALAFLTSNVTAMFTILFGLGLQATLFGPVKYGILPEHLAEDELVAGNGAIEAVTFLAIVAGTVAGGGLALLESGRAIVAGLGVAFAALGLFAAWRIPTAQPAEPSLVIGRNVFAESWRCVAAATKVKPIWQSIIGLSWFWTMGATLITEFPVIVRDTLHAPGIVLTLLLAVFAIGVGAGSMLCARILRGNVSPRFVPFAIFGLSIFCADFALAASGAGTLDSINAVFSTFHGVRMLVDLALLAMCGGLFSVPLYAIIQDRSEPRLRARMIAANNIVNALFMVAGAAVAAIMAALGASAPLVLGLAALINLYVAIRAAGILRKEVTRILCRLYFDTLHGVEVRGLEHYTTGDKLVIVANHHSYGDAVLISAYLPDSPTFAVYTKTADLWWAKPFLAAVEMFKVDVQSPYSVKRMVEAVRDRGERLMIFPEGRLTKTGALMKIYEGAGLIADKSGAKIQPIAIDGMQYTRLGHMNGKLRMRWFPKLSITIMPQVDLTPENAEGLTPRQRREAVGRTLQELMVGTVYRAKNTDRTLFSAFLDARDIHGGKTLIAEDAQRQPISYGRITLGAAVLGRKLLQGRTEERHIGLMLPNSQGTLVTFMALQAYARVPCMLNYSAGADAMIAACRAVPLRTIVSSRLFIEKAKLERVVERLSAEFNFVWLEDIRASIGLSDKLFGKLAAMRPRAMPGAKASPDDWAVVIYTSGSEGEPKGVVHSHRSLLSNCAQLSSIVDFTAQDRVFNAMPMFHSFGLTGATLLPLLSGVRTLHYPSPLHYRIIPGLMYDSDASIAFGTDTFLAGWARYAHAYDFYSMRYIFGGAEKIREETRRLYADRFGVRLLEGYGATETAPVLAMNTPSHSKPGTVGRFLPGIEHRLQPVPGIDEGGQLFVSGPNLMLGYLRASHPGVLDRCAGEYDTGDICTVDDQGYVSITGRAKRFAKIGGEKVSMVAAEALAVSLWPDDQHAVIAVADTRKGEALLLATTRKEADTSTLLRFARERGMAEIMVPRTLLKLDSIPLLGSGKIDYPSLARLAASAIAAPMPAALLFE